MKIIRLDEIDENDITKIITPTDEYAELEAKGIRITVRKFLVRESLDLDPEEAIGVDCHNFAKLVGYSSGRQVRKLITRHFDEFAEDVWSPSKHEEAQYGPAGKSRSEAVWLVGEGFDLMMMKCTKDLAKEYRKKLKKYARIIRLKGLLNAKKQIPSESAIAILEEKNRVNEKLLAFAERTIQQNKEIAQLKTDVSTLRTQLRDSDRRVLEVVDEKINHQQGQRPNEFSKVQAARMFHLFYPNEKRRYQAKFIGAIVKAYDFVKLGLAREGVWIDDSLIDPETGSKGRVRSSVFLNRKGLDQLEIILPVFDLHPGVPRHIKVKETDRNGHNVVWEPPQYLKSRNNKR